MYRKKSNRQVRDWNRKHKIRLKPIIRERRFRYYREFKDACYSAYGGYICSCCGITEPLFLTLDHVNNDGAKFRKEDSGGGRGMHLYRWIVKNNFPKGMFQVLCSNCNSGRARNGGICPHRKEDTMAKGSGDRLARGAAKAQFPSPGANVSQKQWDAIWGVGTGPKPNIATPPRKTRKG